MSEETVKALTQPSFDKLHSMFDLAWECNKSDETRTNLSRMVTDYITHVMQDYSWLIGIVEDISEDRLRELAAAEREGRVVVLPVLFDWTQQYWMIEKTPAWCGEDSDCSTCKYELPDDCSFKPRVRAVSSESIVRALRILKKLYGTKEAAEAALAGKGET